MSDTSYNGTIDWDRYWADANEADREGASPGANHAADAVADFLAETVAGSGDLDAFADVGCGSGAVTFDVAERHPGASVVGYDAAEPVLAENREQAADREVDNVAFERAVLPAFDPDREFDVVFSYFTLCYVADVERALENLYDAVAPGGYLLFNYQNRLARSFWRTMAENPGEYLGEDSAFDPDRFEDRFELLLAGENLLSYDRIHGILGTWPRSAWSVVDRPDTRWAWRHHPLVFVPK